MVNQSVSCISITIRHICTNLARNDVTRRVFREVVDIKVLGALRINFVPVGQRPYKKEKREKKAKTKINKKDERNSFCFELRCEFAVW